MERRPWTSARSPFSTPRSRSWSRRAEGSANTRSTTGSATPTGSTEPASAPPSSTTPYALTPFPLTLQQARAALDLLRSRGIAGWTHTHVGVIGSSAGGLLAGLLATGSVLSIEPTPPRVPRPDLHVQSYGLADLDLLPHDAVEARLGERIHLAAELSPARHVDDATPPTFVWATAPDPPGLPNALEWARALTERTVPVEPHIYPYGWHGLGLADGVAYGDHGHVRVPHTAHRSRACEEWISHTLASQARPRLAR